MQIFTYKKRDFDNLDIHATRIDNQGLFFLSDIQSRTIQRWVLMGFDWTLGYRTHPEMIDLARKLKAILCMFENGKLLECFDFEEDFVLTYAQEIAVNDPLENAPVWNEGVGGVIDASEDVVIDEEILLRFTPLPGFIFKGWYDENAKLISNEQDHKFTVTKSETITARAQKRWYNVSCEFDNDMGLVNGLGRYVHGTEVTLTAIGKMGYEFVGWYNLLSGGTLLSANATYTNSVGNSDMTIYARFQKKWYTVTATKGDYIESVEIGPSLPPTQEGNGTMRIAHGEGVILSCTLLPDTAGYTYDFDGWYDSNVKVQNEGTTAAIDPVTKNISWTAKGKRTATPNYSLTAKAVFKAIGSDTHVESTEGGTVTPTSGSYKNGVKVTLTSEVAVDTETAEYLFDGYFTGMNDGNNLSYSKTYGITINGNTTVYARFSASEKRRS